MFQKGGLAYDLGLLFALGLVAANYQAFNTLAQTAFSGVAGLGAVIQGRGGSSYGNQISSNSASNTSLSSLFGGNSGGITYA